MSNPLDEGPPEIERGRVFGRALLGRHVDKARRVTEILEAREAPRLRFAAADRKRIVWHAARRLRVIAGAAERTAAPGVDDVDCAGRVRGQVWMPRDRQ